MATSCTPPAPHLPVTQKAWFLTLTMTLSATQVQRVGHAIAPMTLLINSIVPSIMFHQKPDFRFQPPFPCSAFPLPCLSPLTYHVTQCCLICFLLSASHVDVHSTSVGFWGCCDGLSQGLEQKQQSRKICVHDDMIGHRLPLLEPLGFLMCLVNL